MNISVPVSVLVLTLNEEQNIKRCLGSVAWSDDVVVLDSYSQDKTLDLAESLGARTFQRKFDSFAAQRNWALDNVEWKYPWVLHLDADEVVPDAFLKEMTEAVRDQVYDCYQVPSKLMWEDTWLRYSGMYPVYQVRLGRVDKLRFTQIGHGQREIAEELKIGTFKEAYLHYGFSKGLDDWRERHRRYAQDEAEENLREIEHGSIDWVGLMSVTNRSRRRRALKQASIRLPTRPVLRFFYMYVLRAGFLDGAKGLQYCRLLADYEAQIVANMRTGARKDEKCRTLGAQARD